MEEVLHILPGLSYGTPKEVWGFEFESQHSKALHGKDPTNAAGDIARDFLERHRHVFGLTNLDQLVGSQAVRPPRIIHGLGADHVIIQQRHVGRRIHRAYVTVHIRRQDGKVYFAKNRAIPEHLLPTGDPFRDPGLSRQDLAKKLQLKSRTPIEQRLDETPLGDPEPIWFPKGRDIIPAWRYILDLKKPREKWTVIISNVDHRVLHKSQDVAHVTGKAKVFDPSPATAVDRNTLKNVIKGGGSVGQRLPKRVYKHVGLRNLTGTGFLDGTRVTTKLTVGRSKQPNHDFRFDWNARGTGFGEAMAYYHINDAIEYVESLGYTGDRAIFATPGKKIRSLRRKRRAGSLPLHVNVHGEAEDNSYYDSDTIELIFGWTGAASEDIDIDDAQDAETILHEFGHALQDAICPKFGEGEEAAAMGEGFGDYMAASFFAERKPKRYRNQVQSWNYFFERATLRRVDGWLTWPETWVQANYGVFKRGEDAEEHDNGEIWSATLWDVRKKLIRAESKRSWADARRKKWQLADTVRKTKALKGRPFGAIVADALIIDSHFQLNKHTTFPRGARAIIDADRNLCSGDHVELLRQVFKKRGIEQV